MSKAGLKVACPLCRRKLFVTTEHFNPDISPNGSMVKFLGGYHIDWLTTSATKAAEMACPECQAQMAPSGRLTVIEDPKTIMETEEAMVDQFAEIDAKKATTVFSEENSNLGEVTPNVGKPVYICEICGKEVSSALALSGHMRSHKGK